MKHRDIFRVPARAIRKEAGWEVIVTFPGAEVAFHYGERKPQITEPIINLVLEYTVPDAQS